MDFQEMFEDYIKTDTNCELLITDWGYGVYQIVGVEVYITNIYLKPEFRGKPIDQENPFAKTANLICAIAKERGCKVLIDKLDLGTNKKKDRIIKYLLWYGMKLSHNEGQYLVTYKEI